LLYTPKYIDLDSVKLELSGKITFSNEDSAYMSDDLILDKIARAESLVELELSRIFDIPFKGLDDEAFGLISSTFYSSKMYISTIALFETCIFLLDSYYSSSDGNAGDESRINYLERIKEMKDGIIDRDVDVSYYWKNPPLPGLKLNALASHASAALLPPMNAVIGARDYNKQLVQKKLINPNANWFLSGPYNNTVE